MLDLEKSCDFAYVYVFESGKKMFEEVGQSRTKDCFLYPRGRLSGSGLGTQVRESMMLNEWIVEPFREGQVRYHVSNKLFQNFDYEAFHRRCGSASHLIFKRDLAVHEYSSHNTHVSTTQLPLPSPRKLHEYVNHPYIPNESS